MTAQIQSITIHVPNVWQTCEWYRKVFGVSAVYASEGAYAQVEAAGLLLVFAAHELWDTNLGFRRRNTYLNNPLPFHLTISTPDVPSLYARALANNAVPIHPPGPDGYNRMVASLRDLNGILVFLTTSAPVPKELTAQ